MTFAESEGEPKFLDINAHFLSVATSNGMKTNYQVFVRSSVHTYTIGNRESVAQDQFGNLELIDFFFQKSLLGYLKVFDLSRREAKAHGPTKCLKTAIKGIESVSTVRANSGGSHVAIIVRKQVNLGLFDKHLRDILFVVLDSLLGFG